MKKLLLVDYPNPGGFSRRRILSELGFDVFLFNLVESPFLKSNLGAKVRKIVKSIFPDLVKIKLVAELQRQELNRQLLNIVFNSKPDYVLVIKGESISRETILAIKEKTSAILINWFGDSLLTPNAMNFFKNTSSAYDFFFVIDDEEIFHDLKLGNNRTYSLPLGYDPLFYRRLEISDDDFKLYGSEVSFVGTITENRAKIFNDLTEFNLKLWAPNFGVSKQMLKRYPHLKEKYQGGPIYGEDVVKIYNASRVVLDIHFLFMSGKRIYNVTPRVFEVPGSYGFVLTNYCKQLEKLFDIGTEIIVYHSIDELKSLIRYYLTHDAERHRVIERAFNRVSNEHTFYHRFKKMFEIIKSA